MAKLIRWLLSASLVLLSYLVTCLLPDRDPPLLNWGKGIVGHNIDRRITSDSRKEYLGFSLARLLNQCLQTIN